jgi:predicted porin
MKVRLLPLAIAAAIAAPGVALADGPTVYGKLNVSYENANDDFSDDIRVGAIRGSYSDDADTWELNSNQSRIGVKGSEKISDSLNAFYQAEFGVDVDEGDSNGETFSQRDIFVGLGGNWGSFQAGRFDSPLRKSQGKVDQFNDSEAGDIQNVIVGENRVSDLLQYSSPKVMDALSLNLAFQPGEEYCGDAAADDCQDGPAENFSASAVFASGPIYAALGYDDGIGGADTIRLTGMATLDVFELGLIYQTAEESEDGVWEQDGYIASAAMKLGEKNKLRFQYGYSETEVVDPIGGDIEADFGYDVAGLDYVGDADSEITQIALGFDHFLSKQTRLFVNYIMLEVEYSVSGNTIDLPPESFAYSATNEIDRLQFGIEHNF